MNSAVNESETSYRTQFHDYGENCDGFADFGALRPLRALGVIASKLWCCGVVEVDLRAVTDLFDLGLHNYHPFDGQNN